MEGASNRGPRTAASSADSDVQPPTAGEEEYAKSGRGGIQSERGPGYTTVRRYKVPDHDSDGELYGIEMRPLDSGGHDDPYEPIPSRKYLEAQESSSGPRPLERFRSRDRVDPRRCSKDEPALVEYGGDPIFTDRPSRFGSRRARSRSRSRSRNRLATETAAAAGVAGLAAHEASKRRERKKQQKIKDREHELLGRHSSDEQYDQAAQAGLESAAIAGLIHCRRSRSSEPRDRSRSRVRQGVPIATAGVAGAAVTGLYERHKAKREARALSR